MITGYSISALKQAKYKTIESAEPFYGEVPGWEGVSATGKSLEECRNNLEKVINGWLVVQLKRGFVIPPIG